MKNIWILSLIVCIFTCVVTILCILSYHFIFASINFILAICNFSFVIIGLENKK